MKKLITADYDYPKSARGQTHRAAQHVPGLLIGGAFLMGGCLVIIWKTLQWTIVGNMFGECHAPCMQKTSFVDFDRVGT